MQILNKKQHGVDRDHVSEFERGQILSVLTFRPEFETPWKSKPHQTQIALNRLTKRQIGVMMRKRTNRQDIPESIVQQIIERTDGTPLFIEEFTIMIIESGILDSTSAEASTETLQVIPATLYDLLQSRCVAFAFTWPGECVAQP